MSTRIWLNAAATKKLVKTDKQKFNKDVYVLDGVEVETDDKSGKSYISIYADPIDPAASMPRVAHKHIKRVSFSGRYYEGFRTNGIYRHKGATARVETVENICTPFNETDRTTEEQYQNISISAGSIKMLREIYSKVRTGELKPAEDWGASRYDIADRNRQGA